jgi:hypothetical protein
VQCSVDVVAADGLGCALAGLDLAVAAAGPLTADQLKTRTEQICDRVACLGEPLKLIEADALVGRALVRSRSPRETADSLTYFELWLAADRNISLRRVRYDRTHRSRSNQEFTLTLDQLEMLADDLAAVLTAN